MATDWRALFDAKARALYPPSDPSHDFLHIRRVVHAAQRLAKEEGARLEVVLPAAYFHDFVNVPKGDPRRKQASTLSAQAAVAYLKEAGYPPEHLDAIAHAIAAHSFSAGIAPETLEAKVVQDADRLDSLGAVGVARCFATGALMGRPFYHEGEPFARGRPLDDKEYAVDHFYVKLFKVAELLQTRSARTEGKRRAEAMRAFLEQLRSEL